MTSREAACSGEGNFKVITLTTYSPEYEATQRNTDRISAKLRSPQSHISIRYTQNPFSYPRAMHFGCEMALLMPDWEWLVMLDADGIFLGMENPPETGFGCCHQYRQQAAEPEVELFTYDHWYSNSSYFILRRDLVQHEWCRYCKDFEHYGYDDLDFHFNVMEPQGVEMSETDAKSIHLWHSEQRTPVNPKNHALYLRRFYRIHGRTPKSAGEIGPA